MARQARVYIPDTAQLVQVRGNNNAPVFFHPDDYAQWQSIVCTIAPVHALDIHAFALADTQINLLITAHNERSLGAFMQDLGRRYVRYINGTYQRTGTLWEGRYRTAFIQSVPYVLRAYVWLDLMGNANGLSEQPKTNEYTSALRHLGQQPPEFIRDHAQYWQLGNTPFERQSVYAQLLADGLSQLTCNELEHAVQTGWALGDVNFIAQAEQVTGRRISPAARGRPKKLQPV
jgi:putative transposase